ncbi:hypothetical protein MPH48_11095 [Lysinibacillus fusiformis]|uniref:hypothetical protein n=1 Tax=Lysinibacillus fusiformis TaxID=28031 RepID=UPI001F4E1987|nr:hypothetical protein [Lysinibacillus fusiformis]MCK1988648.1 hypothetical protein [Lysinibacillus fusiformis]
MPHITFIWITILAICELQMMEKLSTPSKPESISLDRNTLELLEGSLDKLFATVTPDTASNMDI